jgi:hypothetical protein
VSIVHFQTTTNSGWPTLLTDASVTDGAVLPETAGVSLRFNSDGSLDRVGTGSFQPAGEWYRFNPSTGIGSDYEARLVVTSGDGPTQGPQPGQWTSLTNLVVWGLSAPDVGQPKDGTWFVEIRQAGTTIVQASATYIMHAETTF